MPGVSSPCATGIPLPLKPSSNSKPPAVMKSVLLPLYPHYSSTTTGSSLNEWNRLYRGDLPVHTVDAFYKNDLYLEALVEKIDEALSRFANRRINPRSYSARIAFPSQ